MDSPSVLPLPDAPAWPRHGLALLAALAASALHGLWMSRLGPSSLLLPLVAVVLSARLGGRSAGGLATAVCLLFSLGLHEDVSLLGLFVGAAALCVWAASRPAPLPPPPEVLADAALAVTLSHVGDAILLADDQGRVRALNPIASYLTGWREAEARGRPLTEVLRLAHPASREPLAPRPLPPAEAPPVQLGQPALLLSRGGCELPIEHSVAALCDARGRALGTLVVFRDISARFREEREHAQLLARERDAHLEAEAQRVRLETLFLQAPVAICLTRGPEHLLELANPLGRTLGGEGLRIGHSVRDALAQLDPHLRSLLDGVFRQGTPFVGHEVPITADFTGTGQPEVKHFDVTCQPWRGVDGEILGTMGLCVDVTEQVLARREVEALAADLQQALQIRDDFLSVASHELKTPLTSLQLQLQLLWRSLPELDAQGQPHPSRRRIESTRRTVERLHQLVNNLLDVSRIRADRLMLERETVDFAALLQDVVTRSESDAAGAGCSLVLQARAPVIGRWDRLRLEQVVTNLLSNAIKYGAAHPVELTVIQDGAQARLIVRDHGIGIAPEHQTRIFQRFERAVSERHYGGFGLGLWISKQIVDSLGGDIRVESQSGQGATFTVCLPLEPSVKAGVEARL